MSIKLCVDCKHYRFNWAMPLHQCVQPKVAPINVVTGEPKAGNCEVVRSTLSPKDANPNPQLCYEEGVYWEAK